MHSSSAIESNPPPNTANELVGLTPSLQLPLTQHVSNVKSQLKWVQDLALIAPAAAVASSPNAMNGITHSSLNL